MTSVPAVSVVMTAYNRAPFIAEAIESVLGQTFADLELLIVDDRSTDGTPDIAAEYARRDSRVRLVVNESNLGDYPNRNHAARLVRAPYFKYHDSDDVMYPHCLQVMHGMLRRESRACFALTAAGGWSGGASPMLLTPQLAYAREYLGTGLFHLGPAAALFRTAFFHELGGFPERGIGSDGIFWPRACRAGAVLLVPGDLFYWRQHPGQEYARSQQRLDHARTAGEQWQALFDPACPLSGAELMQARSNYCFIIAREVYRRARARQFRGVADVLRHGHVGLAQFVRYLRRPKRSPWAGTPPAGA